MLTPPIMTNGWEIGTPEVVIVSMALPACYANCDGSTLSPVLNVNDFTCFQNRFAAGDPWANCDGSTIPPVLNINDFSCFRNRFENGCTEWTSMVVRGSAAVHASLGIVNPCHAYGGIAGMSITGTAMEVRVAPNIGMDGLPGVIIESVEFPAEIRWTDATGPHVVILGER